MGDFGWNPGSGISEAQARESIFAFLLRESSAPPRQEFDAQLGPATIIEHPDLGRMYAFKSVLGGFWVSCDRGTVITYSGPERFTPTEAEEYARNFLRRNIPQFDQRNFVQTKSEMEHPFWVEAWEEQPRKPAEVAIFPNWVSISINVLTRHVHFFSASDLWHVRTSPPRISSDGARQLLLAKFPESRVAALNLLEHTLDGGRSWITIWQAVIVNVAAPGAPRQFYSLNADTGAEVP